MKTADYILIGAAVIAAVWAYSRFKQNLTPQESAAQIARNTGGRSYTTDLGNFAQYQSGGKNITYKTDASQTRSRSPNIAQSFVSSLDGVPSFLPYPKGFFTRLAYG